MNLTNLKNKSKFDNFTHKIIKISLISNGLNTNCTLQIIYSSLFILIINLVSVLGSLDGGGVVEDSSSFIINSIIENEKSIVQNQKEDLFSSTSKLEELVENELQIVELLNTFADYTLDKARMIKQYVEGQKKLLLNGKSNEDIVAHPIEAFLLVRRLTVDWDSVHMALHGVSNYSQAVYSWIDGFRERSNFPIAEDLNGAAQAIVRLQDTYKLKIDALSGGIIQVSPIMSPLEKKEFYGTHGLTARDMLFFGKHAQIQGLYHRAIEWFQGAQEIATKEINGTNILEEIKPSLHSAIETHDDVLERQGPRGVTWKTNSIPVNPERAKNIKYTSLQKEHFIPKLFQRQPEDEELEHYIRLCRGEKLRKVDTDMNLMCQIKRTGNPYLTISPLKIEVESHDPYIVVIHEFLTPSQTDQLIFLGKPKLQTSMHQTKNGTFIKSSIRTSKTAWIKDIDDPLILKVTKRVQLATGLKASQPKETEDYQIANYGLGGLYVPHTDYLMTNKDPDSYDPWQKFVGDRVATFMIYLSNVGAGGATVFPRSGVALWPKKGNAAFWWNLDRSGAGDENTRHGACPVLYGDKWVSNKWIRLHEQFFEAQCGLDPLDKFHRP